MGWKGNESLRNQLLEVGYSIEETSTLLSYLEEDFPNASPEEAKSIAQRLLLHEPYAYIAGYQPFLNLKIGVSASVLIPRPETEELVQLILKSFVAPAPMQVLDLGTGSGCIALALKSARPQWKVHALDAHEAALNVARKNAKSLQLPVDFYRFSMEDVDRWRGEEMHLMVSNPPYIPEELSATLDVCVREYEPASALFSPANNPLYYYEWLLRWAALHLKSNGWLWVETDANAHEKTRQLLVESATFKEVESIVDFRGNPRFLKAQKK
ncbi:MAG: peptide chain release factor N(5)-glutamine methyltransferase [Bacteroidetes bacterium]|jgi:release factor glutamine methyltransferase|nr:peptide chain release factor N(5)-glutamine methyltransferase [Bacteroidota bacterium]